MECQAETTYCPVPFRSKYSTGDDNHNGDLGALCPEDINRGEVAPNPGLVGVCVRQRHSLGDHPSSGTTGPGESGHVRMRTPAHHTAPQATAMAKAEVTSVTSASRLGSRFALEVALLWRHLRGAEGRDTGSWDAWSYTPRWDSQVTSPPPLPCSICRSFLRFSAY